MADGSILEFGAAALPLVLSPGILFYHTDMEGTLSMRVLYPLISMDLYT